jgi:preprotein translocase subunit SecG
MLLGILLTFHILVCIALISVVLLQRSEGGALGMGGGPQGFMSARGAGDLLTRTTWILGSLFFILSFALTMLSGHPAGSVVDQGKMGSRDVHTLAPPPVAPQTGPQTAPPTGAPGTAPTPLQAPTPTFHNPFGAPEQPSAPPPRP